MKELKLTLKRSLIGEPVKHKRILLSLGLKRPNCTVKHFDTPIIRGMINKLPHLIDVKEL
jgi:large subunit ribosomal protein L30